MQVRMTHTHIYRAISTKSFRTENIAVWACSSIAFPMLCVIVCSRFRNVFLAMGSVSVVNILVIHSHTYIGMSYFFHCFQFSISERTEPNATDCVTQFVYAKTSLLNIRSLSVRNEITAIQQILFPLLFHKFNFHRVYLFSVCASCSTNISLNMKHANCDAHTHCTIDYNAFV